jgi:excisionase family DNA binding protein
MLDRPQLAWLKDSIEFLERTLRWGSPDGKDTLDVAMACEEITDEAVRLGCRLGCDLGDVPAVPTPRKTLAIVGRLARWAEQTVPDTATLTVTEAARLLRVNRDKILGWINSGRLRAVNAAKGHGRPRYRIARADLEGFLASRTLGSATPSDRGAGTPPKPLNGTSRRRNYTSVVYAFKLVRRHDYTRFCSLCPLLSTPGVATPPSGVV